jgi:hypothetical protein
MAGLSPQHQLYADLMDEARIRIHAVRDMIEARHLWAPRLLQEFAYLQLRISCETIAVGCVFAHGDVKDPKTLKSWRPKEMINKLSQLNPDFYPRGIRIRAEGGVVNLDDYPVPQLTKRELIDLWDECGSYLHRGSADRLVRKHGEMLNVDLSKITEQCQKILNLLDQHVISSADKTKHLIVALGVGGGAPLGQASIWLAESPPQKP